MEKIDRDYKRNNKIEKIKTKLFKLFNFEVAPLRLTLKRVVPK